MMLGARPILAGSAYFAIVFALGFVLGVGRTALLNAYPETTRLTAVAIELPILLAASWIAAGSLIQAQTPRPRIRARLVMGGVAFVLLMVAEFAIGLVLLDQTLADLVERYRDPSHALGLTGQIIFAIIPALHGKAQKPR